jgi:transglutaminase-like putative cysteine protease
MTASRDVESRDRRLAPEEGWVAVALVVVLGLIVATAIDEPAWVNGRAVLTDCLAWCALGGILVGVVGAKVGWGRWRTHTIGALFAAVLLPIIAGWAVLPGMTAAEAFRFTAAGTLEAYLDLTARGLPFTTQEVHYVLVLAGLVWGTMQFGSYAVFGHRRPLSAVVVVGLILVANMALTRRDQLGWLVLYAGFSLFLLIQMHVVGERTTWLRRRIGDPGSISLLYLRGGTVFIFGAMFVALILTQRAASSPLAGAWSGLNSQLIQVGKQIGRLLPVGGDVRGGGGVTFGSSATISTQWFSDAGIAFTATVPATAKGVKFEAATYDTFALSGWLQSDTRSADVPAGTSLTQGSPEVPSPELDSPVKVTIRPDGFHDTSLLAPGLAQAVDQPSKLYLFGQQGWYAAATIAADTPYTVTGLVPRLGGDDGITQNELRAASTAYPADVVAEYTGVPGGALGPYAQQLLQTVIAKSPSLNPYDLASTMESFLRSPAFQYSTDVRNLNCESRNVVECFAHYRIGYCQYYASTMAVLLRVANPANPIPTRYVQGFLPSDIENGQETVHNYQAHAWVEVFFPGFGWIDFDPTGGGIGRPQAIPAGAPVPSASAPLPSRGDDSSDPKRTRRPFVPGDGASGSGGVPTSAQASGGGLAVLIAVLLAATLGALIVMAWWRGLWPGDAGLARYISVRVARGEIIPDVAWTTVSRSASWFGFAQRPTETIYEYATSLGELVPVARPDITTIAEAKVETTYARVELTPDREHAVAAAVRRLRLSLVRLLFARGRRRRR